MSRYTLLYRNYGVKEMRLLIVNYIRDNQSMFKNHVDGDFKDYSYKMELDKTWGTYTKLLAFSIMFEIDIDVYDNIQWARPLISIKKNSNKWRFSLI